MCVDQQGLVLPCRSLQVVVNEKGSAGWSVTAAPPAEAGGTDGLAWMVRRVPLCVKRLVSTIRRVPSAVTAFSATVPLNFLRRFLLGPMEGAVGRWCQGDRVVDMRRATSR